MRNVTLAGNQSLDAAAGAFLNLLGAAKGALIRAAASNPKFGGFTMITVTKDGLR